MTEQEWLGLADWTQLFERVEGRVCDRKLRLFAVACCRTVWPLLGEESRRAVEVAERHADGLATDGELQAVRESFRAAEADDVVLVIGGRRYRSDVGGQAVAENSLWAAGYSMRESAEHASRAAVGAGGRDCTATEFGNTLSAEMASRRQLLVEVLGPLPFRPVVFDPTWRTPDVVAVAEAIYNKQRFAYMPALGDTLEDAGCADLEILGHCRRPGGHVRGCWCLDLVLGKG